VSKQSHIVEADFETHSSVSQIFKQMRYEIFVEGCAQLVEDMCKYHTHQIEDYVYTQGEEWFRLLEDVKTKQDDLQFFDPKLPKYFYNRMISKALARSAPRWDISQETEEAVLACKFEDD